MRDYIIRRMLLLPLIMLGVSILTFLTFRAIPGDAVILRCGFGCTPEVVADLRKDLGLDRSLFVQYTDWLGGVVTGDFGQSLAEGEQQVSDELRHRLPITAELMIMTMVLALVLGIPPGVLSAIRPGSLIDLLVRFTSVLWVSIPSFYLAILLITFGVQWFGYVPPQFERAYVPFMDDPWVNLQQFFFPSLVISVGLAAALMRLTRSSMLEVMGNDYVRTAWSKGLRERAVVWRHALKNAMIPVLTVIGLQIGGLLGGSVLIESVYNLNGVGKYALEAIIRRDIFVVQSLTLLFATVYVVANLAVDVAYAWLDPRIHYA